VGTAPELAHRFEISAFNVRRIKQGLLGRRVPFTPTVDPTPSGGKRGEWLGRKLTQDQHEAIRSDRRRGCRAAREVGAQHGVAAGRVLEIWHEADFAAAKAAPLASLGKTVGRASKKRLGADLIVAVRAATGSAAQIARRFGIKTRSTVSGIKRGSVGWSVPYTPTVDPTPDQSWPLWEHRSLRLIRADEAVASDMRRDSESARELAAEHGVNVARVWKIWREADFATAKKAYEARLSERDAEVVAGRVGEVQPNADVPLGDRH
jgi:hypothetical protein